MSTETKPIAPWWEDARTQLEAASMATPFPEPVLRETYWNWRDRTGWRQGAPYFVLLLTALQCLWFAHRNSNQRLVVTLIAGVVAWLVVLVVRRTLWYDWSEERRLVLTFERRTLQLSQLKNLCLRGSEGDLDALTEIGAQDWWDWVPPKVFEDAISAVKKAAEGQELADDARPRVEAARTALAAADQAAGLVSDDDLDLWLTAREAQLDRYQEYRLSLPLSNATALRLLGTTAETVASELERRRLDVIDVYLELIEATDDHSRRATFRQKALGLWGFGQRGRLPDDWNDVLSRRLPDLDTGCYDYAGVDLYDLTAKLAFINAAAVQVRAHGQDDAYFALAELAVPALALLVVHTDMAPMVPSSLADALWAYWTRLVVSRPELSDRYAGQFAPLLRHERSDH
jgi:hypothetical protein